ncbi:hypothetical protein G9A89_023770 [Geosiphon pyriformis]|nr:hypothetical protein G9A89_023770 [Geosiphon pyriformis]
MNTTYTAINIRPWLNPQCKIIGVFQQTAICMNYYLYGIIAVSTYLKVNRRIIVDFGRYDYKLFSLIILLTMSTVLPGIFKDGFGQQNLYWCALKAQHNFIYTSFVIGTMLSVVIVTSFCFLQIFLVLARRRCDSLDTLVDNNIQANTMSHYHGFEDKVTRKIASYVLVFMLQWVPVLVFLVTNILQKTSTWTLITVIVGINLGGIGNSLAYIMNESLYKKDSPSSTTSSKGSFWTNGRQHRKLDPNNGELDKQIAKDIIPLKPAAHPKQYQKHWNGVC